MRGKFKYNERIIATFALFAFSSSSICAATSRPEQIDLLSLSLEQLTSIRVVSAASGYSQPVKNAPASVSIISEDEWRSSGAKTLNEAIALLPGIHISKVQTGALKDKISIRGLSGTFGEQVLVLIDGKAINRVHDGGVLFAQHIPLAGFKRIEVVRGPGSAIYGADAVAGVINLVSYDPDEHSGHATLGSGSFSSHSFDFQKNVALGENNLQFALAYMESADDRSKTVADDLQTTFDGAFGTEASKAPGRINEFYKLHTLNFQWQFRNIDLKIYDWRNIKSGLGGGVAQALDPSGYASQRSTTYSLNTNFSKWVQGELDFQVSFRKLKLDTYYNIFPAGTVLPIGEDGNIDFVSPAGLVEFSDGYIGTPSNNNYVYDINLTHVFEFNKAHTLRWKIGSQRSEYHARESKNFGPGIIDGNETEVNGVLINVTDTEYVFLPEQTRNLKFISLQDEWSIYNRLSATLGVRYDDYSSSVSAINPRFGLNWALSSKVALRASAGTAFRTPSFTDLYARNNPAGIGNPDLKAEKNKTFDFTASFNPNDFTNLSTTFFRYSLSDLIEFTPQEESGIQLAENVGEQNGRGIEFSASWRNAKNISVDFNYTLMSAEDKNKMDVAGIATQKAYLGLTARPADRWSAYVGAQWVAGRERAITDSRDDLEDYLWLDARIAYEMHPFTIAFKLSNITDADAREPSNGRIADDYPLQGRKFLLELGINF